MSFDEQNVNAEVPATESVAAPVEPNQSVPAIPQPDNLEAPELKGGVQVADAAADDARVWEVLEEEEAEEAEEAA